MAHKCGPITAPDTQRHCRQLALIYLHVVLTTLGSRLKVCLRARLEGRDWFTILAHAHIHTAQLHDTHTMTHIHDTTPLHTYTTQPHYTHTTQLHYTHTMTHTHHTTPLQFLQLIRNTHAYNAPHLYRNL